MENSFDAGTSGRTNGAKSDQLEIALNKRMVYIMLFGSVVFVLLGMVFVLNPPEIAHPIFGNPIVISVASIAAILFFGFTGLALSRKITDRKPGLVVNAEGILDNASGVSAGFIPWTDVLEVTTSTVANQQFLMVIVKNPQEYIDRQRGFVKRKAMLVNYKSYGSPVSISPNALQISFEELYRIVQFRFNESKQ